MVCRENKGRSAQMGIVKAFQRQYGQDAFNDAEVQSLIHQVKHDGDALDNEAPMTREEQIDMMRRLRSQVAGMDAIPESEKYRQSDRRPGVVTRIDQEIKRLETGKNERGEKLSAAQLNSHSHIYAMQRLGNTLERVQPAKDQFLETNARHRGISFEEARSEWNTLMNRPGNFTSGSKVRDDVRESLATAGVDSQTQVNLGASGRAVAAMEVMEERRRTAVDSLERRPTAREAESLGRFVHPDSPQAQIRCGSCGQFGHDDGSCPNLKQVRRLDEIREDYNSLSRAEYITDLEEMSSPGVSDEHIASIYEPDDVDQWRQEARAKVAAAKESGQYLSRAEQNHRHMRLAREEEKVRTAMDANQVQVSDSVSDVSYNEHAGVLIIRRPDDENGHPQAPIVRRCRPQEAADVADRLRSDSLDEVLGTSLNEDRHKFANRDDAEAALTLSKCPTCGQWASMSSAHQCPVSGGPSEELEQDRRRRRMEEQQERRRRQKEGGDHGVATYERQDMFTGVNSRGPKKVGFSHNGQREEMTVNEYRLGKPSQVMGAVDDGAIATPSIQMTYPDGQVRGKVAVWYDENSNEYMMSRHNIGMAGTGLKCNCADYEANSRCKHVTAATTQAAHAYNSQVIKDTGTRTMHIKPTRDGVLPGESRDVDRIAPDGLDINEERVGVNRLLAIKDHRRREEMEQYVTNRAGGQGATTLMVEGPKDESGEDVDWPDTWSPQAMRDDGGERKGPSLEKITDLNDDSAVADRFRLLLSNRTVTMPDGSSERMKFAATRRTQPGGITINLPRKYRNASPARRRAAQRGLADMLGVSPKAVTDKGVFVPSNTASYAEFLERAAQNKDSRRINGPRTVALPTQEQYDASRDAANAGRMRSAANV